MAQKKVLLVDDEPDLIKLFKFRLEANGFEVVTAADGKEALEKIRKEKPDVVLLDIQMPKLDGLKVLREIRKTDKRLPVFMLTAFSDQARFEEASKLEASGFIVKTSDLQTEIENITSALRLSGKYRRS